MHEENGLIRPWNIGNRNGNSCRGGQETGRHAHGSPVPTGENLAQQIRVPVVGPEQARCEPEKWSMVSGRYCDDPCSTFLRRLVLDWRRRALALHVLRYLRIAAGRARIAEGFLFAGRARRGDAADAGVAGRANRAVIHRAGLGSRIGAGDGRRIGVRRCRLGGRRRLGGRLGLGHRRRRGRGIARALVGAGRNQQRGGQQGSNQKTLVGHGPLQWQHGPILGQSARHDLRPTQPSQESLTLARLPPVSGLRRQAAALPSTPNPCPPGRSLK